MSRINELRLKRGKTLADARAINEQAAKENRNLTEEERANYTKAMADFHDLGDQVKREEELEAQEERMSQLIVPQADMDTRTDTREEITTRGSDREAHELRAFENYLITGDMGEYRALQADSNVKGGFLQTPQQMVSSLIQAMDDAVVIRGLATTYRLPAAQSLGRPSLDNDPDDPEWTTELATGNTDATMSFGKRELHPHPVATKLLVSDTLLRAVPSAEQLVRERLAYKMAIKHENAFMNGDGDKKPLGLFTASADGITTARDVATSNTTTAITADNLKYVKGSLKQGYRNKPTTRWIFHRDAVTAIGLLKDNNNRYLLQDSIAEADGMRLLGIPIVESEYAPNTFTTGLYVGILGDMSHYWIADALSVRIQRLVELYAATDQVGFHVRSETDGMPDLAEAFARVKLA
jgi:HK97 family phage major capsid protein